MGTLQASPAVVRFGIFEADLRAGELRRDGVKVRLQDLPFRMLALLLSRPKEIVSHEELRHALWPSDVFVDFDRAIRSAVKRLRDAIGDSADNPIFIETIERRGYRWIGPSHSFVPASESEPVATMPAAVTPGWRFSRYSKFILVLPVLALLFAAWIFRPAYHAAKAGSKPVPPSAAATTPPAGNREAQDFYLQGRFYWNKRTPESLNKAVDDFTQAIVRDPNYAPAYVGLADCYNLLREYTAMPASEAYPRAFAAAKKAVELDDRSSEAHASLAFASYFGMLDVASAEREFRRALELDPSNAKAHHWYASFLHSVRRDDESLSEIERARALDPNSSSVLADKGRFLWVAGHRQQALELLQRIETAEPNFRSPHRYLKLAHIESGEYSSYLLEMKEEAALLHDNVSPAVADAAEKGFAFRGARGLLEGQLQQEKLFYEQGKFSPYLLAETYAWLGRKQEALKYLQTAYDQRADGVVDIEANAAFNCLRGEPAFQQMVDKIGLPPVR
jgi:DNA-binding winged helix-turn-helix (wHTH) protein/Tfp pilus assembly protein PilF